MNLKVLPDNLLVWNQMRYRCASGPCADLTDLKDFSLLCNICGCVSETWWTAANVGEIGVVRFVPSPTLLPS